MINNYYNYLRNFLTIIAMLIVCGNAGATPVTFGTGNSTYEENADGSYTVTLKAAGDLKAMENTWSYGSNTPWKSASKLILYLDESIGSSTIAEIKEKKELYLLTQNTTVCTLDLSNLTSDQADNLKPGVNWPGQWSTQSNSLRNIIVPAKYAATPNNYSTDQINFIGKTGSTIYLYRQYNNYDIEWSLIRNDETTLKIVGEYSNGFNISNATYFENIDLTTLSFSSENAKITLPTVGAEGVALTKIIVISNDAKSMIANTDATTLAAIKVASSGSGDSGEGGEGGGGSTEPEEGTLEYKIYHKLQLTDVPTIYLTIPDVNDIDNDLRKFNSDNNTEVDVPYHDAEITVVDNSDPQSSKHLENFTDELQIKVRGNSTARVSNGKRPYRLKFPKKHKHDLLGNGYSKRNWTLLANAYDKSLIRNAVTYHLGQYVGMPFTAGYKFVDLVINGDYRGCYQVSDYLQADKDRININEDTGWYLEYQGTRPDMLDDPNLYYKRGTSGEILSNSHNVNIKNPDCDDLTEAQIDELKTTMNNWLQEWQGGFQSWTAGSIYGENGWKKYNDIETAVRYCIMTEITGDYDGFMTTKFYREGNDTDKLHWGPVWDKDLAYGNCDQLTSTDQLIASIGNSGTIGGYAMQLYGDPLFIKRMKTVMDSLVTDGIKDKLIADVTRIGAGLTTTREEDYKRWTSGDLKGDRKLGNENDYELTDYSLYLTRVKNWFETRIPWLQGKIDELYNKVWADENIGSFTYDTSQNMGNNGFYGKSDKLLNITMTNRDAFVVNGWNAICLPFDVSTEQLTNIFGTNYELKEFSAVSSDGTKMIFTTPANNAMTAAVPYLIKPSKTVDASPVISNTMLYYPNPQIQGKSITFGNYTFQGYMFADGLPGDGTVRLIGSDVSALTTPQKVNNNDQSIAHNGAFAYIKVLNDAANPTISFTPEVIAQRTQLTNLPTIYIDTKDNAAINPSSGDWTQAGIQVIDGSNTLKPFVYAADDVTAKGKPVFQIRGRGAASWTNAEKKSYRIQFGKDDKDADGNVTTSYKHYLLGDEDAAGVVKKRNWVLLANAGDKTLVRNALTKEIGDIVELPFTPGYKFVDLVLNGTYVGTYQVTEFIEADANRVNIDEDNGLLIQMTGSADTSTGDHIIAGTDYTKPYLTIKNPEIKTADQETWNAAFNTAIYDFDGMWNATNGTGLDKSTLVNWYIASEITGNYEALSSIYAYLDATTKNLCFGPLWNNETAFDNHASINMTSAGLMNDLNTETTHNGLLTQAGKDAAWKTKLEELWTRKWFAAAVYDRWKELYDNGNLTTTTLTGKVDELAAIVNNNTKSSQALNFSPAANGGAGWTITGQGITDYSKDVTNSTYTEEVSRLKTYLEQRLPYLDKKFKILGEVDGPEITIGTGGYSSFSWDGALDFSGTGVEVYVATSYVKGILQLEKVADGKIPAETGVILKGNEGDKIYPQTISKSVSLTTDNKLLNTAKATFTVPSENSYYALATLNGKTALYKIRSGVTIPLNKAYLCVESQQAPAAIFFGDIDGGTTGLNEISVNADSQHEAVYDLQGRRMKGNLAKGIYIKNGKKFIVK